MMKREICVALFLMAVLGAAEFVTLPKIKTLRAENAILLKNAREMETLLQKNKNVNSLREQNKEIAKLRSANRDLPRLRNEIVQLRRQWEEMRNLQRENEQLAKITGIKSKPDQQTIFEIQYKKKLRDVGLGMPLDTLQTWMAAAAQGNIDRFAQCMAPELLAIIKPSNSEEFQKELQENLAKFDGYEIIDYQQSSADEVIITMRMFETVNGSNEHSEAMRFKRIGNEWKASE